MLLGLLCLTIGLIEPTIVLFRTNEKTRTKVFYLYSYLAISGFICVFIFGKRASVKLALFTLHIIVDLDKSTLVATHFFLNFLNGHSKFPCNAN